ncbi:MAG: hypothetical protein IPM02_12635 [Betaproteobacteria bacterium]|nr:hypothetical protein [Betaproteobacteria bacterium]
MSDLPENPETSPNPAAAQVPEPTAKPVPETIPLTVPSEYGPFLDRLLALATSEILVFDQNLRYGDWNSLTRTAVLRDFLLNHRHSRLQIVVHETTYIEGHLPRLVLLLRDFSHKFSILRTIEDGRNAWDSFVIVDGKHLAHRFHLDSTRGELSFEAPLKARVLRDRYEDILAFTEPGVNATQLGL